MNTEVALIEKAKKYNEIALAELCEKYYKTIYTYLYYRCKSIEDTEDLTHEVFVRMVNNIYNQKGNFKSWIFTIAKNLLTDYYRKKHNIEQFSKIIGNKTKSNSLEDDTLNRETLRLALEQLPQVQQDVVVLKYISDLSNKDVAKIVRKSEGAVKVISNRALKKLKLNMEFKNVE